MTQRDALPYRGPCQICGCSDARHRDVEAWAGRVIAGDDPDDIAFDFGVPVYWVIVAALASGWRQSEDVSDSSESRSREEEGRSGRV